MGETAKRLAASIQAWQMMYSSQRSGAIVPAKFAHVLEEGKTIVLVDDCAGNPFNNEPQGSKL